ncbi:hypothetical protein C8J57DRAFT_1097961 [Mycena rebaudengoi]|nr:hypothetical protein C8J57DRAFT_1097961 [Mycena rebaudengoi]
MQAQRGRFRLDRSISSLPENPPLTSDLAPSGGHFTFRAFEDPAPPPPIGSYAYDLASGKYELRWADWASFLKWKSSEEESKCIELRLVNTYTGTPPAATAFERQCRYVCSRGGTGGIKPYTKRHPEWRFKLGSKRTDCRCSLLVKEYPGIKVILGNYLDTHNHPLGNENIRYTQIPKDLHEYIAGLLRLKVAPEHILQLIHHGVYHEDALFEQDLDGTAVAARSEFIQLRDIRRIEKKLEAENVRLHPDDGRSTLLWVENLRAKDHLLGFKSKTDPPPPSSNLASDVFFLAFQTSWQRKMFAKHGEHLLCIDATHNVTMYEKLNLTTLVVRDRWAHGI